MSVFIENQEAYDRGTQARIAGNCLKSFEQKFKPTHPEIDWDYAENASNDFIQTLIESGRKYAKLSDKQLSVLAEAIERQKARDEKRTAVIAERDEERQAEREALLAAGVAAPTGRVKVIGRVLHIKEENETAYGNNPKMLIQAEEGYKIWVSVFLKKLKFSRCSDACNNCGNCYSVDYASPEVGDLISFTVTLEVKEDVLFAFGSRPTKLEFLENAEERCRDWRKESREAWENK